MATRSFDEMMVIDTPEKAANLNAAYQDYLERGPLVFDGPDLVEEGEKYLRENLIGLMNSFILYEIGKNAAKDLNQMAIFICTYSEKPVNE